jgi:hypothetical protein
MTFTSTLERVIRVLTIEIKNNTSIAPGTYGLENNNKIPAPQNPNEHYADPGEDT